MSVIVRQPGLASGSERVRSCEFCGAVSMTGGALLPGVGLSFVADDGERRGLLSDLCGERFEQLAVLRPTRSWRHEHRRPRSLDRRLPQPPPDRSLRPRRPLPRRPPTLPTATFPSEFDGHREVTTFYRAVFYPTHRRPGRDYEDHSRGSHANLHAPRLGTEGVQLGPDDRTRRGAPARTVRRRRFCRPSGQAFWPTSA
jgi:ribosomal protein L24E